MTIPRGPLPATGTRTRISGTSARARCLSFALSALLAPCVLASTVRAAENLRLAPGLSFSDDSSARFPIEGDHLDDAEVGQGRATIAFFGAAHCWNTNREAERLVAVYPKFRDRVRFVVVDVEHPSEAQRALLARHYHGSIPTLAVFAPDGTVLYARAGETASARGETSVLEKLLADTTAR